MNPNQLKRLFPNASQSVIKANLSDEDREVHANKQQPVKRRPLERIEKREGPSTSRFEIRFTIYSVRPLDWDNYHVKELQDALVHAGILHSDDWRTLRGSINPQKAYSKEEECTIIEINRA